MKKIKLLFFIVFIFILYGNILPQSQIYSKNKKQFLLAQNKIILKKAKSDKKETKKTELNKTKINKKEAKSSIQIKVPTKSSKIHIYEKDTWLALGLSLTIAGSGHIYLGRYTSGAIFFWGSYGFMAAGILATISAHSTRDIVVNGTTVREEDHNITPLSIMGALFISSGIIFYIGSIIDVYFLITDYNRRIRRIRRYNRRRKKYSFEFLMKTDKEKFYLGQTFYY